MEKGKFNATRILEVTEGPTRCLCPMCRRCVVKADLIGVPLGIAPRIARVGALAINRREREGEEFV
jgi:hypothetical protein